MKNGMEGSSAITDAVELIKELQIEKTELYQRIRDLESELNAANCRAVYYKNQIKQPELWPGDEDLLKEVK